MIGTDRKPLQEEPLSIGLISHVYLQRRFGNRHLTFSTLLQNLSVAIEVGRVRDGKREGRKKKTGERVGSVRN